SAVTTVPPSSSDAPAANRPCGLVTRTGRPPNSSRSMRASRWTVCPSGTSGGGARRLVGGELVGPALVALVAGEGLGDEGVDQRRGLLERVHASTYGDDVLVVVLPAERGGLPRPGQDGAHTRDL